MWKVDSVSGSWCTGVPPKKNAEILPVIYAKRKKLGNNRFFLHVCEIIFFFFCSGQVAGSMPSPGKTLLHGTPV
jgi:hypothetical protein